MAENITIKEIVADYLTEKGYDGLYDGDGCGCQLNDLMPCENWGGNCMAGYVSDCNCGEGCNFHVGGVNPKGEV